MDKIIKKLAIEYSLNFSGFERLIVKYRPYICPFGEVLSLMPQNRSLLDVGSGSGFLIFLYRNINQSGHLYGIETDFKKCLKVEKILKSYFSKDNLKINFWKSFNHWSKMQFEIVTLIDVLHHIDASSQVEFLSEVGARVKPGGQLIYKDICGNSFIYGFLNRIHDLILSKQWVNYVPVEQIEENLNKLGFELKQKRTIKLLWYKHVILSFAKIGIS